MTYFENSHSHTNREDWKFTYKGYEIREAADRLRLEFRAKELSARGELSVLLSDPKISQDDPVIERLRREITSYGRDAEACAVFQHEFKRMPDREFHLSLGDVVYFGLHEGRDARDNP